MLRRILSLVAALLCTCSMVAIRPDPGRNRFAANHGLFQSGEFIFARVCGVSDQPLFFRPSLRNRPKLDAGRECMAARPRRNKSPRRVEMVINQRIPTYVDQAPFGNSRQGQYNPYLGMERKQPLTEFQQVVAGSVGQVLPIFGANLFSNSQPTSPPSIALRLLRTTLSARAISFSSAYGVKSILMFMRLSIAPEISISRRSAILR